MVSTEFGIKTRIGAFWKAALICCLLTACGNGENNSPSQFWQSPNHDQCLNCDASDSPQNSTDYSQGEYVRAIPEELSFFGDADTEGTPIAQVAIVNQTDIAILITNVRIMDVETENSGKDGATYFEVDWAVGIPITIAQGDQTELEVTFSQTTEQRSAKMLVTTSHPDFPILEVGLTGKYFLGDGSF